MNIWVYVFNDIVNCSECVVSNNWLIITYVDGTGRGICMGQGGRSVSDDA
jgi:hypothetical protein